MDALAPLLFLIGVSLDVAQTPLSKIEKLPFSITVPHFLPFLLLLQGRSGATSRPSDVLHVRAQDVSLEQTWKPPATIFDDSHEISLRFPILPRALPSFHFGTYQKNVYFKGSTLERHGAHFRRQFHTFFKILACGETPNGSSRAALFCHWRLHEGPPNTTPENHKAVVIKKQFHIFCPF